MSVVMKNVIIQKIIINCCNIQKKFLFFYFYSRTHRGKGLAAFLKAIGYLIPLVSTVFPPNIFIYLTLTSYNFYRFTDGR